MTCLTSMILPQKLCHLKNNGKNRENLCLYSSYAAKIPIQFDESFDKKNLPKLEIINDEIFMKVCFHYENVQTSIKNHEKFEKFVRIYSIFNLTIFNKLKNLLNLMENSNFAI